MIGSLVSNERGAALIIVLAFMVLGGPLASGALVLASALATDSRVKTAILKSQYSTIGASQHAIYRLVYEAGYGDGLTAGVEDSYIISLNGEKVTVSVLKLSDPPDNPPPPTADSSRRLQTSKEVAPSAAPADTTTIYDYTISVENRDDEAENLNKVHDELPPGFSYVAGSTAGVTTSDPAISGQKLTWELAPLGIMLQPGQSAMLSFQAQANAPEGNYCNEAWAEPGGKKTSTGKTAVITVGSPPDTLCEGVAVELTKSVDPQVAPANVTTTFTYTITIDNAGTDTLNMTRLRDLLPVGFTYVAGSTSGSITTQDPNTTITQDRQRLDWDFSPAFQVSPGASVGLNFDATAQVDGGDYWNEVWMTLEELADPVYSWPTAKVEVMGVFETRAAGDRSTVAMELWVGDQSYSINQWNITR